MNIEARKISLAHRLFAIQTEAILDKIDAILTQESTAITKEQKKAIDMGIKSLDDGHKLSHETVMNLSKKKYPNLF
jgi:hypothetical protein